LPTIAVIIVIKDITIGGSKILIHDAVGLDASAGGLGIVFSPSGISGISLGERCI